MEEPLHLEIPKQLAGTRFDRALAELVPDQSRAQLQKLVRRGRVKLDGRKVLRSNFKLRGGEKLLVHLTDPNVPKTLALEFLHIESTFAIVNKPAGMITHPTESHSRGTVADLAVERLGRLPTVEDSYRPGIVHRLDRETSGILVLARTPEALDDLRQQFRERKVEKRYLALVHGTPPHDEFDLTDPVGPVPGQKDLQRIDPEGRPSETAFRVLKCWSSFALIECRPKTGRRHQLRVHLHSIGHPVVGDKLYRPAARAERNPALSHHALHAESLAFDHPESSARVQFRAALSPEFAAAVDSLA